MSATADMFLFSQKVSVASSKVPPPRPRLVFTSNKKKSFSSEPEAGSLQILQLCIEQKKYGIFFTFDDFF